MASVPKVLSQEDLYNNFKTLKKEAHNLIENGMELEKACRKQDVSFENCIKLNLVCNLNP